MAIKNKDIRYRAHCTVCKTPLGDAFLKVKDPRCFEHQNFTVEQIKRMYKSKGLGATGRLGTP